MPLATPWPLSNPWTVQKYAKVPRCVKVWSNVKPAACTVEFQVSTLPATDVVLWSEPIQTQWTVSPG